MYNIIIYKNIKGTSEIEEFIKNLQYKSNKNDHIIFNKIVAYVRELQENGLSIGEPYIKHINGNIWELRPLRYRILFACVNNKFILLNVFTKNTRKTPKKEIDKAKRLLEDYIKRSDGK